jgi:hypothetical protein
MRKPIQPIDGYVHKFRLDAHDGAVNIQLPVIGKSVHGGWVLTKFVASALVLSAVLVAAARTFGA